MPFDISGHIPPAESQVPEIQAAFCCQPLNLAQSHKAGAFEVLCCQTALASVTPNLLDP